MTLLESLLDAIVRLDGDALVMHVGEKPYVVTTSSAMSAYRGPLAWGQVELSSRVLTSDAVLGMVGQILPAEHRQALDEVGAVEHEIASPAGVTDRFTVVAARGGDDIWLELRRHAATTSVAAEPVAGAPAAAAADETAVSAAEAASVAVGLQEPPPRPPSDAPSAAAAAAGPEDPSTITEPTIEERVPVLDEVGSHAPEHVEHIVIPLGELAAPELPPAVEEPAASADETTRDASEDAELEIVEPESQGTPTEEDVEAMLAATASALLSVGSGRDAEDAGEVAAEPDMELAAGFFEVVTDEEAAAELAHSDAVTDEPEAVDLTSALDDIPAPAAWMLDESRASALEGALQVEAAAEPATIVEAPAEVEIEAALEVEPVAAGEPPAGAAVAPAAAREVAEEAEAVAVAEAAREAEAAEDAVTEIEPDEPAAAAPFAPRPAPILTPEIPVDKFSPTPPATTAHEARAAAPAGAVPSDRTAQAGRAAAGGAPASVDAGPAIAASRPGTPSERPGSGAPVDDQVLLQVLHTAAERGASTVYVVAQSKPMVRVDGEISALEGSPVLAPGDVERLIASLAPAKDGAQTPAHEAVEWASEVPGAGRVRCLTFRDRRGPGIIFRLISARTISADYLNLSPEIRELCAQTDGLVLVTGARGSGKTTLLNSLVDLINRTRSDHVVTVENEVAFVHESQRSFVSQREASEPSFAAAAIHSALREDPDVLMVEDVTSSDVALAVLDAADSGRLVLASITAGSAASAIDALIDLLPEARRRDARMTLSLALRGVVSQVLVRKTTGGRTAARELLLNTTPVAPLIVDAKAAEITKALETGQRHGMVPLSDALSALVRAGSVHQAEAVRRAPDRKALLAAFERDGLDTSFAERLA